MSGVARALRFEVRARVRGSHAQVWSVLGDFGQEHRWTRSVRSCRRDTPDVRIGTVRECTLPRPLMGRTHARETLTEYEPGRALGYILEGDAGPFASASSRWSIRPLDERTTEVRVEGRFTPKSRAVGLLVWPLARPVIRRLTRKVLAELDAHVAARRPPAPG